MPEYTDNLKLFKYNTETDGKEVFSINEAMNHNWDILDKQPGTLKTNQITDCILEAPNGVVTYSGNTITIKQGLKVLIPNGRNADGTLKNIEYVFSKDVSGTVATDVLNQPAYIQVTIKDDESVGVSRLQLYNYVETEIQPAASNTLTWYNPETNYVYRRESENWTPKKVVRLGIYIPQSSSSITVYPFQPFRAVDCNDTEFIAHQAMPSDKHINLSLQASGATYTAPADGWFQFDARGDYAKFAQMSCGPNKAFDCSVGTGAEVFIKFQAKKMM